MTRKLISTGIATIVLYLIFFRILPYLSDRYGGCYIYHDMYIQSIRSKVFEKYIDAQNHNDKVLVFRGNNNEREIITASPELLEIYDLVEVGDSIYKKKNSMNYKIIFKATGKDTTLILKPFCPDNLKRHR